MKSSPLPLAGFSRVGPPRIGLIGGLLAIVAATVGCPGPAPNAAPIAGAGGAAGVGGAAASGGGGGHGGQSAAGGTGGQAGGGGSGGVGGSTGSAGSGGVGGSTGGGGSGGVGGSTGGGGVGGAGGAGCALTLCGQDCVDLTTDPAHCGECGRACALDNVVVLACSAGACTPSCKPGFLDSSQPAAPAPDDGCETQGLRVFVTSSPVPADFGGAVAADSECQSVATGQGLGGAWKAWVSDTKTSPAARFFQAPGPYVLVDGTVVASDWAELTSGGLKHAIDLDEQGAPAPSFEAWTGTLTSGVADPSGKFCADWTSTQASDTPYVGASYGLDATWSELWLQFCDRQDIHLFCFEQ